MVMKLFSRDRVYSPNDCVGEYTLLKMIGEGRYGICYLASKDGYNFIIKQLKGKSSGSACDEIYFEEQILGSMAHERIPRLISKISFRKFNGYVLEYKEGKTFDELIYKDNHHFPRGEIFAIGHQLVQILKYLHGEGVVHRDIRVPNTIYHDGKVYVVDFGLSRWIDNDKYTADIDFSFLGDFLLHLYYTTYDSGNSRPGPWFEELDLGGMEKSLLKRLMGIEARYRTIDEIDNDFGMLMEQSRN